MASTYKHGIKVLETERAMNGAALEATSGLQVIVGTAPVNLAKKPEEVVNTPVLCRSYSEAVSLLGYSDDWEQYTLCQSIAMMSSYLVAPVVFINVLDPAKHKKENAAEDVAVNSKQAVYRKEGVIPETIVVKNSDAVLAEGKDYVVDMTGEYPTINLMTTGSAADATVLNIASSSVDPSKVTQLDVIGGYDTETGEERGIECIRSVYPMFGMVPGLLLAPGWSQIPAVAAVMQSKTTELNGVFDCFAVIDIDTEKAKSYTKAKEVKDEAGITGNNTVALWPMVKVNGKIAYYSAVWAAMTAYTDANNGDIPYKSPSSETLNITATCLKDGKLVRLDTDQAASLNGDGIVTAVNDNGWKSFGNNTACYPGNTQKKDRWIACRRMMNWYKAHFIMQYKENVDDPNNPYLTETLVDSENLYLNGLTAAGYIAGGAIEYLSGDNPIENVMEGQVVFRTNIAFWTPAEYIENNIIFNPALIQAAFEGTE